MNYRAQKQIIIGLGTLIFLTLLSFGIYALLPTKVPPNGALNGDSFEPEAIEVVFSKIFEARPGVYDVVSLIKNPNTEVGASDIGYTFSLLDASGSQLFAGRGETFILPGEERYILEPALDVAGLPASVKFSINDNDVEWKKLLPFSKRGLALRDTELSKSENSSNFTGIVKNGTPFNLQEVDVQVALFTQGGDFVSAGGTQLQTLARDSERFFKITWPYILPQNLKIDARVESNFLENSNFIREFGAPQEF